MIRAAALYRVSTKRQAEEDSIPTQQNLLRSFAAGKGWTLVREYIEPGVSAYKVSSADRDILQDAMADAEAGLFDVLLVFKADRLSRQALEYPQVLKSFISRGIQVIAVADCPGGRALDMNNLHEVLLRFIEGWQAEYESKNTSIRVAANMLNVARQGRWTGGRPPYGFKTKPHLKNELPLEVDEQEASILREMVRLIMEEGMGGKKIANVLNARGLRTREGRPWSDSRVRAILQNPIIAGIPVYNRTRPGKTPQSRVRVKNSYDLNNTEILVPRDAHGNLLVIEEWAIIPLDQWLKITHTMRARANNKGPDGRSLEASALLTGFLKCGYCGRGFISSRSNNAKTIKPDGKVYTYQKASYRCITHARVGKEFCQGQGSYSQKKIDAIFMAELETFLGRLDVGRLEEYVAMKQAANVSRMQKELKELEQQRVKVTRRIMGWTERLNQFFADPGSVPYTEDLMAGEIRKAQQELAAIEAEIAKAQTAMQTYRVEKDKIRQFARLAPRWFEIFKEAPVPLQKRMLSQVIEKVTLWRDRLEIMYNVNLVELGQATGTQAQEGSMQLRVVVDM